MAYDIILADIDNTLLDFTAGEKAGLERVLQHFGLSMTAERLAAYASINDALWKAYERGEVEKAAIYPTRFQQYMALLGVEDDPMAVNEIYKEGLHEAVCYMPNCLAFLNAVHGRFRLYGVTNGETRTQVARLKNSGIGKYFDQVFISEQMGTKKPEKLYFDRVLEAIGPVDKRRCILLGDSLTSDMQGGRNAGIDTCYLGAPTDDPRCDYVIQDLMDLLPILEGK